MLQKLLATHKAGQLQFFGQHAHLAERKAFAVYLASPPKRMTASWSGPRRGQPNTRSRRDPSRAWRAPLGSLLFAVLDVTDGGSRTVLQPLPHQQSAHSRAKSQLPRCP
jgi:hypothetical protein